MERTKRAYHRKSNGAKRMEKVPAIAEPIQCPHCSKILSRIDNYMVHLRIHTGEMPYNCKHCSKTFRHPSTRKRHQLVCDNRDEDEDDIGTGAGTGTGSDTDADNEAAYNSNNKTSNQEKQGGYHNSRNEPTFKKSNSTQSKSVLKSQNSNETVSPSPSTSSSAAAKVQKQILPSNPEHSAALLLLPKKIKSTEHKLPFPCKYCTVKFSDYFQLLFHERQYHLFNIRPFSCLACSRRFPRKSELDSHRKIHRRRIVIVGVRSDPGVVSGTGSLPPSPVAQPSTSVSNNITVERNKTAEFQQTFTGTGTGPGPSVGFSCPICKFVCKSKQSRRLHLLIHTGEKTHFCRFCPKSFLRKGELRVHELRMHLNYKPHKCLRCGKQYTLQTTLKAHQLNSCNPAKVKRAKALLQKNQTQKNFAQKNTQKKDPPNLNPISDSDLDLDLDLDTETDQGQSRIKSVQSSRTSTVSKSKSTFQFQSRLNNINNNSSHQNSSNNTKKHVYCQFCNKKYTGHNYLRKHMITSRKCAALKGKAKSKFQQNLTSSSIAKDKETDNNSELDSSGSVSDNSTVSTSRKSKIAKSKVSKTIRSKSRSKLGGKTSSSTKTETRRKSVSGQKTGNSSKGTPGTIREGMSAKRLQQFKKRATSDPNLVGVKIGGSYYYKCAVCSKTFRPAVHKHAVEHTWTHTGYKPHRCPKCNLGFLRVNAFNEHMAKCKLRKNIHQGANNTNQRRKGDASSGSGSD